MAVPQLTPEGEKTFDDQLLGLREGKLAVMTETLGIAAPPKLDASFGDVTESPEDERKRSERITKLRNEACKATTAALLKLEKGSRLEDSVIDTLARYFAGESLDVIFPNDESMLVKLTVIFRELMKEVGVLYSKDVKQKAEKEKAKIRDAVKKEPPVRASKKGKPKNESL